MTLTPRQRAKINAALCLIYDNGHDAKAVIQQANGLMQGGHDPRSAYEAALNDYLDNEPALTPVISKVLNLVDASDDATVDQYDAALSDYLTTGDDSTLTALAPMIAQDSIALGLQTGEITQEEAASGDLTKALGFEPGPALIEAVATGAQAAQQQPSQPVQRFDLWDKSAAPQIGGAQPARTYVNGSQVSASRNPAGVVAPKAAQLWAREAEARAIVRGETEGSQSA